MPYCSQCGSQHENEALFCSKCGKKTGNGTPPGGDKRPYIKTVINRFDAPQETVKARHICSAVGTVILIIMTLVFIGRCSAAHPWSSDRATARNAALFFGIATLVDIAISVRFVMKKISKSKSFVSVCEEGVYGITSKGMPFEVEYEKISTLTRHQFAEPKMFSASFREYFYYVYLVCGPHMYECYVDDPDGCIKLIKKMMLGQEPDEPLKPDPPTQPKQDPPPLPDESSDDAALIIKNDRGMCSKCRCVQRSDRIVCFKCGVSFVARPN
jgi:hypothetical protein